VGNRTGDPGARGAPTRGRAIWSRARAHLCSSAPARDLFRPRKWNATVKADACRSRFAGLSRGNARVGQRNHHLFGGGSSGAKASLACEESTARRVCPRIEIRLQKSANDTEVQRSALPRQRRRVDGNPGFRSFARMASGSKGVDNRYRGGKATAPGKARAGCPKGHRRGEGLRKMEGIPGRHSGSFVHAGDLQATLAAPANHVYAQASRGP